MSTHVQRTGAWLYQGLWGILTQWFRVPAEPPTLPVGPGEMAHSFQPAEGYLRYLKFQYWLAWGILGIVLLIAGLVFTIAVPLAGLILGPLVLAAAFLIAAATYAAIHLRYDTTWYVLTDRSLRIRRGIWIIHETTITYENIQNVSVDQGPLQRFFGIADVLVQTAGGGGGQPQQGQVGGGGHHGLIEGITDAAQVRDLLVSRMRQSRSAGLGDEHHDHAGWTPQQIALLREVRDAARELAANGTKRR